jgi:glucose-6-phosphate isomerase
MMILKGVWNSSFLNYPVKAIIPYSEALSSFADHIQQVDMESNGKGVTLDGVPTPTTGATPTTGEIVMGSPGTNSQHSFFQLFHQV